MELVSTQERIRQRLRQGASLGRVEHEIIVPAPFSEEQKAALRLFASTTARHAPPSIWRPERTGA